LPVVDSRLSNISATLETNERHTAYIVILRRVRVTYFAVENQDCYVFSVYVCNLSYPVCNAHVPFLLSSVTCLVAVPYLVNGTFFREKVIEHNVF